MPTLIEIIVYSCIASASFDDYHPYQIGAGPDFVRHHPEVCDEEREQIYDRITLEQCQSQNMLRYMPGWLQRPENADRVWLGARCEQHLGRDVVSNGAVVSGN